MAQNKNMQQPSILGWREWLALPGLGIAQIKAKVDTGARTSALHAFYVEPYRFKGADWIRFGIHPVQRNKERVIECQSPVKDRRRVTDSGGHEEKRYVIETDLTVGGFTWPVEITLTDRDSMKFRMLLGRTALRGRFLVDPDKSYLMGKKVHSKDNRKKYENRDTFPQQ